ncbi:MAG: SGNH/GDSL hydrolase family protein, partial [Chitinophagales bacterium]
LGIMFYIKDQHIDQVEVMETRDYPYLYYLFKTGKNLNQHGFKTNYSTVSENNDNYRILLLGGSVARGYEADSTIAVFLEKELERQIPGKNFEVINAGISAFVLQQEFILLQSIGMVYKPDMVIGVDGYNDIATQWYNRFYDSPHPLPPHHWGDFRVIRDNRFKSKPYSRFAYFFKNVDRLKAFLLRKKIDSNIDCNSQNDELKEFISTYRKITLDIKAYCKGYKIPYFQFVQPLQFYNNTSNFNKLDCREQRYFQRYELLNKLASQYGFMYSLNAVIPIEKHWWKDECHVSNKGNALLAKEITNFLKQKIVRSSNH